MQILPFDNRPGKIWLNGKFVEWSHAKIHVLNHGLHYGSCVFEGIRVYDKKIFKLRQHVERLFKSANILDLEIPFSLKEVELNTKEIIKLQKIDDGYIRPVAWRGSEMMAISATKGSTNLAIAAWKWPSYFSEKQISKGIKLTTSKWRRPSPDSAPTDSKAAGLYMICSLSKHEAESKGFDDALMLDYRGNIAEATGANIFFVKDKKLFTPLPDCFLDGITRQTVINLAKDNGIDVIEDYFELDFLESCQEIFLTGTAVEITPVGQVDGHFYDIGEMTRFLIRKFNNFVNL